MQMFGYSFADYEKKICQMQMQNATIHVELLAFRLNCKRFRLQRLTEYLI